MTSSGVELAPRVVLDTSAYARLRVGNERLLTRLAAASVILVPVIVLGELEAGFALGMRARENRVALADFLAEPFVEVISLGPGAARHYGRIFAELRRSGTPIPVNDIWIAASTAESAAHLLTFDRHFAQVEGLDCSILE
jgi:tRNA(fMet)-specific endonuclease VapC